MPQEEISVQTVQDDHSAQVLKMATIFQNIFEDKPLKKGWTKSKRPGKAFKKNCVLSFIVYFIEVVLLYFVSEKGKS